MKAIWSNKIVAEADKKDLIHIEGNWYFPPNSIKKEYFKPSDHRTICFWKGQANYDDIIVNNQTNKDAAWHYPAPMDGAIERVKKDFSNYIAFWHGVEVIE